MIRWFSCDWISDTGDAACHMDWSSVPLSSEMNEANTAAEIAARYHGGLFNFAMALSRRNRQEALEIVQQIYMEVLEGRADLKSAKDPRAYLFGVARRVAASRRRRRSIWGRILGLKLIETPGGPVIENPEDQAADREQIALMKKALVDLPDRQREVVALVFAEDMSVEEAAKVMGVSVGSARTHYHRAKKRLLKQLEENDDADR
ncbi:MAG: sigma-70 family RNA polymerase sigma factor [Proteobacteria bacterium]|nr:sigma-70 family RNA polymerase sigma factor [Pseudomonadota bacterium]